MDLQNKELKKLEWNKNYYWRNRERILKEGKERRDKLKEEKLNDPQYIEMKQNKIYVTKMKEKLRSSKPVLCEVCNKYIRFDSTRRHNMTIKHKNNLINHQHQAHSAVAVDNHSAS